MINDRYAAYFLLIALVGLWLFAPFSALAFCPLCVVATGALTGLFRWLGVDDLIIGLWLGGFLFSTSVMAGNYLKLKVKKLANYSTVAAVALYGLTIILLYFDGILSVPYNRIFGISRIIIGLIGGSLLLLIVPRLNKILKRLNNGENFISHQKMLLSIFLLLFFSLIAYFL
ncbi:MAG: hypothetical protein AAB723_01630 [Patescibacteria group bacterium]